MSIYTKTLALFEIPDSEITDWKEGEFYPEFFDSLDLEWTLEEERLGPLKKVNKLLTDKD